MRTPFLTGLGLLVSSVLASEAHSDYTIQSPPVYILKTTQPATKALGKALDILGYSRLDSKLSQTQGSSSNTYFDVTSVNEFVEITKSQSEAKFILAQERPSSRGTNDTLGEEDLVRFTTTFFAETTRSQSFLELDMLGLESAEQAQNWVLLCTFLGMGYSTVERLGLWHFPQ
ncbi:hypothetical protein GGR54DRAFT_255026 [Hypoxylon sp. NC1633]|nr:hypothetical protein GGR54DRAFT_255026 [Hypoxylon sp. NC1633]